MVEDEISAMREAVSAPNDAQLAEIMGYTRGAVTQWRLRGKVPPKAHKRIADIVLARQEATARATRPLMTELMDGPIHPEEIKARLRIRYGTVQRFEQAKGLSQGAVSQVINTGLAWQAAAEAIAGELGVPLHRVSAYYYKKIVMNPVSRNGRSAHRQNAEAR